MGPLIDGYGGIPIIPYTNAWLDHCSGFSSSQFGQYNQAGTYPAASSPGYAPYHQQPTSMPASSGIPSFTPAPFRPAPTVDSNQGFFSSMFPPGAYPPPSTPMFSASTETVASSYDSSSPHSFSSMSSSSAITIPKPRRSSQDSDVTQVPLVTQPAPALASSLPSPPTSTDSKALINLVSDSPTPTPHPSQTNTPVSTQDSIVLEKACPGVEDLPIGPSKPVTVAIPEGFGSLDPNDLPRQVAQEASGPPLTYPVTAATLRAGPLAPVAEYYRFHHESIFHTCIPRVKLTKLHNRRVDGFKELLPVYDFELIDAGKADYLEIRSAMMLQVVDLRATPPSNLRRRRNVPEAIVVGDELRRDPHHVEFLCAYYRSQDSHAVVLTTRKVDQCKLISREASWNAFMTNLQRLVGLNGRLGADQLAEAAVKARRQARHHVYENVHAACSGVRSPEDRDSRPNNLTEAQTFVPYMLSYFSLPTS
ncbi:uncharacterized protein SCHCODRAFT_02490677 [Schizophyllum commune H4-8]|nr:uncharacterized protein SCHCODRAFT_02490677 [Schizophyllum commune H4-8]KAI5897282.1 hypothetical protein SCHCODRAFT_02490677 [Schizophyllum commune H4-8]